MDRFYQALISLLPQGLAWPRDPSSTWMRVMRATAQSFAQLHDFIFETVHQWQPHTSVNRLQEWEQALKLPDACFGSMQTEQVRRDQLLGRLRSVALYYDDSSPACLTAIQAICADFGMQASVRYNHPFRVGQSIGRRLGALDGQLYITLQAQKTLFRVGMNKVGDPLLVLPVDVPQAICVLGDRLPARFALSFVFT